MGANASPVRRRRKHNHGVYCIEADWWRDGSRASVQPVLELLHRWDPSNRVEYIHRDVATRSEFEYYVDQWCQSRFSAFPVLYVAMHGNHGYIEFGDRRKRETKVDLDELGNLIAGRGSGRMVHFGSCNTLKVHGGRIRSFLKQTRLECVSGYGDQLDWFQASALDALWLGAIQDRSMRVQGLRASERELLKVARSFHRYGEMRVAYR